MRKLLIATRNKGKFLEIKKVLKDLPFKFLNLDEVKKIPRGFEVEETGKDFKENAILKAKGFAEMSGLLTLADDSGLTVEALGGWPGIHSARHTEGADEDRYRELLKKLKNVPWKKRMAQFRCVIAIFDPKIEKLVSYKGVCEGRINYKPKGSYGFGYDPVFYLSLLDKTTAQLTTSEKSAVSHRGKALRKAKKDLEKFI